MRRLFLWGTALLLLCGCAGEAPPAAPSSPLAGRSGNYQAETVIRMPGLSAAATISQSPQERRVTFTSPESLAGMEYRFDGDSVDVLYRGLSFSFDPQSVPAGSAAGVVAKAVEQAVMDDGITIAQTDTGTALGGMLDAGAFTLLVDPDGVPCKLLLPDRDMEIEFGNFRFFD